MNFHFHSLSWATAALVPLFLLRMLAPQNDPAAERLMKDFRAKYEAYKNMKIQYVQTIKNAESDLDQTLGGTLYLMGNNFRIETAGQILMSDNNKLYIYFIEENELTIDFVDEEEMFKPSDLFSLYDKDFKYQMYGTAAVNGQNCDVIQFSPLKRDAYEIHSIWLYISKADKSLQKAEIKDKGNNMVTYEIRKITPNLDITQGFFRFDTTKHPGVIVTDNTK
jgi:outer membrane lipoprotein carrier protein